MALEKAVLYNADTGANVVACHFNPNELTITKANQWAPEQAAGANVPDTHFTGGGARTLTMSLLFDTYEAKTDVRSATNLMLGLMEVSVVSTGSGLQKRPPHIYFGWGQFRSFRAVLTQLSQRFTLFLPDGTPARATLQVTMQEVPKEEFWKQQLGQNPTSHAAGARQVHTIQPGETIDFIAASELGEASLWRVLAEANGLDDPRRLQPGQTLLIPPRV